MANITLKGNPITTSGELMAPGTTVPEFTLVAMDLSERTLSSYSGKLKLLNIFPSVDTDTCSMSVRLFYKKISKANRADLVVLNISKDLPFALGRFCQAEKLENVEGLSAFRSSFARDYQLEITSGPLMGLCSRAVILLSADNKVIYSQQVAEITEELNYDAVEKALQ